MRTGFLLALFAPFAACLPAAAQTNAPPDAGLVADAAGRLADVAEAALRDNIPSLAFDAATNALAQASSPEARERAFSLAAAARERTAAPADMIAWLDEPIAGAPAGDGIPPSADYFRARALAALGRHGEAIVLLGPLAGGALGDSPLAASARRDLAYSLGVSGRVAEALGLLDRGDPADVPAALDLARLLLSSGDSPRALALLEPLCADTNAPPALAASVALLRALALGDTGAVSNALEALEALSGEAAATNAPAPPADIRALALASRAELLAEAGGDPATNALAFAEEAATLAQGAAARLDCGLARLRLRARAAGVSAQGVVDAALALVAAAPGFPPVAAGVRDAAQARLAAGDPAGALELADLFVKSFAESPDEAAVLRLRAAALAALGRHDEAAAAHLRAAEFAAAAGDAGRRAASLLAAASEQRAAGHARAAAALLDQVSAADPPDGIRAALALLSAECVRDLDPAAAPDAFVAVGDAFPGTPEATNALYLAAILVATGADPADTNALERARALFVRAGALDGEAGAAIDALAASVAASSGDAPAAKTNGPPDAVAAEAAAADPDDERAAAAMRAASMLGTALVALKGGRFDEALPLLDNVAATPYGGSASEQAAALRPSVLVALGRPAEALAAYTVFTNANPGSAWLPDVRFWRAAHAFDEGDWPLAADLLAGYARDFPGTDRAEHALHCAAVSLLRANRFEEVGGAVRALATAFPSSALLPAARFAHGEALCRLLRFDEAADVFRALVSSDDPALAVRAGVRLGDCLFTLGGDAPARYGESLGAYRAALASPACAALGLDAECAFKIGRSLEKAGRADEALGHYYEAVLLPYEAAPRADAAPWYSRAVFAAAALLRAGGDDAGADTLLARLARSSLPGSEEAARLLGHR